MKWQDRQRSTNIIDTIKDPIAKLMLTEMANFTDQGIRRHIPLPGTAKEIISMRTRDDIYMPPIQRPNGPTIHSPGGHLRRYTPLPNSPFDEINLGHEEPGHMNRVDPDE